MLLLPLCPQKDWDGDPCGDCDVCRAVPDFARVLYEAEERVLDRAWKLVGEQAASNFKSGAEAMRAVFEEAIGDEYSEEVWKRRFPLPLPEPEEKP